MVGLIRKLYKGDIAVPTFDSSGYVEPVQIINYAKETVNGYPITSQDILVSREVFRIVEGVRSGASISEAIAVLYDHIKDISFEAPEYEDVDISISSGTDSLIPSFSGSSQSDMNYYLYNLIKGGISTPEIGDESDIELSNTIIDLMELDDGSSVTDALSLLYETPKSVMNINSQTSVSASDTYDVVYPITENTDNVNYKKMYFVSDINLSIDINVLDFLLRAKTGDSLEIMFAFNTTGTVPDLSFSLSASGENSTLKEIIFDTATQAYYSDTDTELNIGTPDSKVIYRFDFFESHIHFSKILPNAS